MAANSSYALAKPCIYLITATGILLAFLLSLGSSAHPATARTDDSYGPACGVAYMDGVVNPAEWSSATTQTVSMVYGGEVIYSATLYVMNSSSALYMGITINDDEFSTYGQYLPQGDGFRIDFDNDHSGMLFEIGDDVLDANAGAPQFRDNYLIAATSSTADVNGGGTTDGSGAASRFGELNHFELRHPLCSGDSLDFCLQPGDTVGFRLEYLDAQGTEWGGSALYPGSEATAIADIIVGTCSEPDWFSFLPLIRK
jgi:hypothetical protein